MTPTLHFDVTPIPADHFARDCARSASALRALGLGPGQVVALMLNNEPVLLELMLAARTVGAHYCLVNWHFKAAELRHVLSDSGATVLVVHSHLLAQVQGGIPDSVRVFEVAPHARTRLAFELDTLDAESPCESWASFRGAEERPAVVPGSPGSAMVYTSGTTGLPKGIRRAPPSAAELARMAEVLPLVIGVGPGMRALVSAPMYHSAPASYILQAALHSAMLWIEPRFDAEDTLRLIHDHAITHAYLVPTMFRRLLRLAPEVRVRYRTSSLRYVASTGAPCDAATKRAMIDWLGPVIHESYAASELGWITHIDSEEALRKPGSVGRALPGTELAVFDAQGERVPPGTVGLIHARSGAVPDFTYANNDGARREVERNGLWTLKDMGYLDEDGYLYIVDRQSDMVISGGVNIYPAEIEAALVTMPGVADATVFGVPDEDFGEALLAAVQTVPGVVLEAEAVRAWLRERIASYKVPRQVVFHAALPREDTGKIFKRKLREPYWAGVARRV
jgi:long-chain acyl-CoA synthetase